jgi:hypothetical protein
VFKPGREGNQTRTRGRSNPDTGVPFTMEPLLEAAAASDPPQNVTFLFIHMPFEICHLEPLIYLDKQ